MPCLRLLIAGVHQLHKQVVPIKVVGQAVAVDHLRQDGRGRRVRVAGKWESNTTVGNAWNG